MIQKAVLDFLSNIKYAYIWFVFETMHF